MRQSEFYTGLDGWEAIIPYIIELIDENLPVKVFALKK